MAIHLPFTRASSFCRGNVSVNWRQDLRAPKNKYGKVLIIRRVPEEFPNAEVRRGLVLSCQEARFKVSGELSLQVASTQKVAVTSVPSSPDWISNAPPNCRARSRMPWIPTPARGAGTGIPLPRSRISSLILFASRVMAMLAELLSE